jgi:hypothetical protein
MRWRGEGVAEKVRTSVAGWPAEGYMVSRMDPVGLRGLMWPCLGVWAPRPVAAPSVGSGRSPGYAGTVPRRRMPEASARCSPCFLVAMQLHSADSKKEGTYQIVLA